MKTIIISLLAIAPCFAQDAKIIIVERSDSQKLSKAYKEYKEAQAKWESVKTEAAKQYTYEKGKPMPGWEKVQFSIDFRALVPDVKSYYNNGWNNNYIPTSSLSINGDGSFIQPMEDVSVATDLKVRENK